jgi:hypothetical protein
MENVVEQYQAWGGGITLPTWTDMQGWQEGNFSILKVPGTIQDMLGSTQAQAVLPGPRGQVAEQS